jgi:[protein-PII] uridylyltransferase
MQFVARHGVRLSSDTERRVGEVQSFSMSWPEFRELLALPYCAIALRAMAELGLLAQLLPEWRRIDCLVVRDFYHRYTVDEHTLVAIRTLQDLRSASPEGGVDPRRRFATLFDEIDHPELLRLALLLHDVGKGDGTGEHAAQSTAIARIAMDRLQAGPEERDTVLFLIERHLDLSSIMTSRDLREPATAKQVAGCVGTIERLKLLTLLTYADISAVNPTAMTPWRMEQLWRVYLIGQAELTRGLASDRITAPQLEDSETAAFLEGLPTRYLRTHSPAEIEQHRELAKRGTGIELSRLDGAYQITVVTPDKPFLLASISGALASFGFNILKAEAWANRRGLVLDCFIFSDPHRTLELNETEADRVRDTVERAITGKLDVAQLIGKRRRTVPVKRIQPVISSSNEVSETSTMIEIVAEDRPGLLYDVTSAISSAGANIEVVLIDTEAHKALDVFYVTAGGQKLSDDQQRQLKARLIEVCSEAP